VDFIANFMDKLQSVKAPKKLMYMIRKQTACFGPKRCGPNILINKFMPECESIFSKIQAIQDL
jgi:hypothetical protein